MAFGVDPKSGSLQPWMVSLFHACTLLSYANSAINPVLYAFTNDIFKKAFAVTCRCGHVARNEARGGLASAGGGGGGCGAGIRADGTDAPPRAYSACSVSTRPTTGESRTRKAIVRRQSSTTVATASSFAGQLQQVKTSEIRRHFRNRFGSYREIAP